MNDFKKKILQKTPLFLTLNFPINNNNALSLQ